MISFLRNIKNKLLLKRLHKLSVKAYALNTSIKKSDLPSEIKINSSTLTAYYTNMLLNFNSEGVK